MVTYRKELKFESAHHCPQSSYSRHVILDKPCCSPLLISAQHPPGYQKPAQPLGWGYWHPVIRYPNISGPQCQFSCHNFHPLPFSGTTKYPGDVTGFREGAGSTSLIDLGYRVDALRGCSRHYMG